jgi:hypothetical protein
MHDAGTGGMVMLAIHDRASFEQAILMIAALGEDAVIEAATRADAFRDRGEMSQFCRWRQVERAIQLLELRDIVGELH